MHHQFTSISRLLFFFAVTIEQTHAFAGVGCLRSETGSEYLGEQNITSSGRPCVRWDEVQGAFRDYIRITFLALPDRNASNAKNFCRNPNNDSRGVWCFVNLLGNVQFCNVPRCTTTSTSAPASTASLTTPMPPPPRTTTMATSPAASQVTSTFLVTKATTPSFRHSVGVGLGWEGDDTPNADETISDYVKPVIISNSFEEMSAPRPTGIVTDVPVSTPNTIYLTLKQPASAFGSANNMIDMPSGPMTTTPPTTQAPVNYQRRPFDEWEEDPEDSVSADDTPSSWNSVDVPSHPAGMSEKIYSEDIPGAVKMRTGSNILLGSKKDMENESTKVVIQRSSHLSSSSSSSHYNLSLLLFSLVVIITSLHKN